MRLVHLRPAHYRVMPWKNGKGSTTEIAREPADGEFDWRVSVARVDEDGPFSFFPGYDRMILALDGDGMQLSHEEPATAVTLGPLEPWRFRGEWTTRCTLRGAPFRDFNAIVRRGAFELAMDVVRFSARAVIAAGGEPTVVYCASGESRFDSPERLTLRAGETLVAHAGPSVDDEPGLCASGDAVLVVTRFARSHAEVPSRHRAGLLSE